VTLWGDKATEDSKQIKFSEGTVIAAKSLKIFCQEKAKDDGRRILTATKGSVFISDPKVDEANTLRELWSRGGIDLSLIKPLSAKRENSSFGPTSAESLRCFADIDENLIQEDHPLSTIVRGTIILTKSDVDPWYNACATEKCGKKVVPQPDGSYHCPKCRSTVSRIVRRYILSLRACDHSGSKMLTCFNESGQAILGYKADELAVLKAEREEEYGKILGDILFTPWELRIKAQRVQHNENNVVKYNIADASRIDFRAHSAHLLDQIRGLETQPRREPTQASQSIAPVHLYSDDAIDGLEY